VGFDVFDRENLSCVIRKVSRFPLEKSSANDSFSCTCHCASFLFGKLLQHGNVVGSELDYSGYILPKGQLVGIV
jgi:hypothetical protein